MEDSEVKTEISEPMESQSNEDKIDMSLDEIIKLNKRKQKVNRAVSRARNNRVTNRNNVLKKLNQVPQSWRGLRRGTLQYQGPSRSRGLSRGRGPGRRGTLRGSGLSPLSRAAASAQTEHSLGQPAVSSRGGFRGRGRGRGGLSRGALSVRGQRGRGGRPFLLDRGFATSRGHEKLETYQKIRSQRMASSPGTTLRVSLPNTTLDSTTQGRPERGGAVLRGRSTEGGGRPTPKGIPLRFNYRGTTNHVKTGICEAILKLRNAISVGIIKLTRQYLRFLYTVSGQANVKAQFAAIGRVPKCNRRN
ncbi:hypothetical protein P4O66_016003 [Electrophorus voltai]|uniref:Forty-two-three domain-containing protein 1 n=1 Tax=Electrophorus voltai TaxID=2609070 RepID=A0AAD8YZ42_9TELE|nr:hypothetical protein P4O66_016003 [Electrophorus voltai]